LGKICQDIVEDSVVASTTTATEATAENAELEQASSNDKAKGSSDNDNGNFQGMIIVVSKYLLEVARGYPARESDFVSELLLRLKAKLGVKSPMVSLAMQSNLFQYADIVIVVASSHFIVCSFCPSSLVLLLQHCRVKHACNQTFASLVHTLVVILRALPKSRPLVLKHGLVGMLAHCRIGNARAGGSKESGGKKVVKRIL